MNTLIKAIQVFQKPNTGLRIISAINKSPLRHVTKFVATTAKYSRFAKRKSYYDSLSLTNAEQIAVQEMETQGYTDLTKLVSPEKLAELEAHCLPKLANAEAARERELNKNKDFWIRLSDEDIGDKVLDSENPMVKYALQESVLKIACGYLRQAAFLDYVLLTLSVPSPGPLRSSQLWHFDQDDTKMLKMFVYLTDVNEIGSGPFTFFNKEDSAKVKNSFIMRHLQDDEIFASIPAERRVQMIRPKLSCFMVDTTKCYHMGSRLTPGHHRLLYTALFTGIPSNYPWGGREKIRIATANLSPLQLQALTNS